MLRIWIAILFLLTPALSGVAAASPGHVHGEVQHTIADVADVSADCWNRDCGHVHGKHCSSAAGGHCATLGIWDEAGETPNAPGALPDRVAPDSDPARPTRELTADPPPPRS